MIPARSCRFARRFSLEATRPSVTEIATLAGILPAGTPVYFTAVPTVGPQEVIEAAVNLRKAGLEPVVHIAARRLPSADALNELLGLHGDAKSGGSLVIGGDAEHRALPPTRWRSFRKAACARPASRRSGSAAIRKAIRALPRPARSRARREDRGRHRARPARAYRQPVLVFARAHPGLAQATARLRHHQAGEGRHGRPGQPDGAGPLRAAVRVNAPLRG